MSPFLCEIKKIMKINSKQKHLVLDYLFPTKFQAYKTMCNTMMDVNVAFHEEAGK